MKFDLFAKSFVKETRLVQGFNPKMYYDVAFIDTNVLWCCLMDPFDLSRIRKYLEYLKQKKQPKIKEYDVLMAVRLKCNIIKHVTYLITNNSCTFESLGVDKSIFWFCLEEAITVADTLPTLHRIMFFIGKVSSPTMHKRYYDCT